MMKYKFNDKARQLALDTLPLGDSVLAYFEQRRPTGDFLAAVISNDLVGAFSHADDSNTRAMRDYVFWLYNYAPARSIGVWGSREAVAAWLSGRDPGDFEGLEEVEL